MYKANLELKDYNSTKKHTIEVLDMSFDIEQTLNIGSQSTGAGAGKVTFNPLSITKRVDSFSPEMLIRCASGTPFETATFTFPDGLDLTVTLKLVAVKTIGLAMADPDKLNRFELNVLEEVTFEYGGLILESSGTRKGWNHVRNVSDDDPKKVIQ